MARYDTSYNQQITSLLGGYHPKGPLLHLSQAILWNLPENLMSLNAFIPWQCKPFVLMLWGVMFRATLSD